MVDAEAYAFRLPEVYATACATCYLPLDEIRITDGWQRQRVAAPRGSNSLHHRACILGVPTSPYRDCPARDASFVYDPDLACVCGTSITREFARTDRKCIVVAHLARSAGAETSDGEKEQDVPRVRLYHERCMLGSDRPVVVPLVPDRAVLANLASLAFLHTQKTETRLFGEAMYVLAPGYSLAGLPIFAWVKSAGSPELDRDKGERSALARFYYETAVRKLAPELTRLGARLVSAEAAARDQTLVVLHRLDHEHVYVECTFEGRQPPTGVYPFIAAGSGATGETGYGGGGVSVGLIRPVGDAFIAPQPWIDRVAALHAKECEPTHGLRTGRATGRRRQAQRQTVK